METLRMQSFIFAEGRHRNGDQSFMKQVAFELLLEVGVKC